MFRTNRNWISVFVSETFALFRVCDKGKVEIEKDVTWGRMRPLEEVSDWMWKRDAVYLRYYKVAKLSGIRIKLLCDCSRRMSRNTIITSPHCTSAYRFTSRFEVFFLQEVWHRKTHAAKKQTSKFQELRSILSERTYGNFGSICGNCIMKHSCGLQNFSSSHLVKP